MGLLFQKFFSLIAPRFFFAAVLLAVFSLHTAAFNHEHNERVFGGILQAIVHGEDKKWFADFLPGRAIPFVFPPVFFLVFYCLARYFFSAIDPFREALRRGVIHPKLYA
jgi:hypothetical protein